MARARDHVPRSGNAITDVPGVGVGHVTMRRGKINTGVTAIIPQPGNLFLGSGPIDLMRRM